MPAPSPTGGAGVFVSLGSMCEPNHMLRFCGLKQATYPFDWIVSMDGEEVLEILRTDFAHFADTRHLVVYDVGGGPLLNERHRLEFLHEGDWRDDGFAQNMPAFQAKYRRRIARFRALREQPGPLWFLRASYPMSLADSDRRYRLAENLEVSDAYAQRLYDVLAGYFAGCDVRLIVVNTHDRPSIEEELPLAERILKLRVNPGLELGDKVSQHRDWFARLSAP